MIEWTIRKGRCRWVGPIEVLSIRLTNGFVYSINGSEIGEVKGREQLGKVDDGWMDGRMDTDRKMAGLVTGKTMRTTWVTVKLNARRSDRIRTPISSTGRAGLELRSFRPGLTKRRLFPESEGRVGSCHGDGGEPRLPILRAPQESHQKGRIRRKTMFGLTISRPETI